MRQTLQEPIRDITAALSVFKQKTSWSWDAISREFERVMGQKGPSDSTLFRYASGKSKPGNQMLENYVITAIQKLETELHGKAVQKREQQLKLTEETLLESEQKFKAQFQGIPVPTYTWKKTQHDFVLVDYNKAAALYTEGNVEQLLGKTLSELYSDMPEVIEAFSTCFEEKTSLKAQIDYQFRSTKRRALLEVDYVYIPPDMIMVHTGDITDREQAKRALEESEQRYRSLVDLSPDAIGVHVDEKYAYMNTAGARLFGVDQPEGIIGKSIYDFIHPDSQSIVKRRVKQTYGKKRSVTGLEERFIRTDGQPIDVEVSVSAIEYQGQRAAQIIVRNITERKQLEQNLRTREALQKVLRKLGQSYMGKPELQPLMDQAVQQVADVLGVDICMILLLDPDGQSLTLQAGVGIKYGKIGKSKVDPGSKSHAGYTLQQNQPIVVDDFRRETRFKATKGLVKDGVVSGVGVPMIMGKRVIGVLGAHQRTHRQFTDDEITFLEAVAQIIALAVEQDQAKKQWRQLRREYLTKSRQFLSLSEIGTEDEALQHGLRVLTESIQAQYGAIAILNKAGHLERFFYTGISEAEVERIGQLPVGKGILGALLKEGRPLRLENLSDDSRSVGFPEHHPPMTSFLGVPMFNQQQQVIGRVYLTNKHDERPFTEEDEILANAVANQIAVALENARLYSAVNEFSRELEEQADKLSQAYQVGLNLAKATTEEESTQLVLDSLKEQYAWQHLAILLMRDNSLEISALDTPYPQDQLTMQVTNGHPLGIGVTGWVAQHGQSAVIDDVQDDARYIPIHEKIKSEVAVPIMLGNELLGVINVESEEIGHFDEHDVEVLQSIAAQLAIAISNLRKEKELKDTALQVMTTLAKTVEAKDAYTEQHCQRIAEYAQQLGIQLGLTNAELEQLYFAGILHDVGKIGVSEHILGKPGKLSEEEWDEMKKHPEIGEKLVTNVKYLEHTARIIGQHHERWDGIGYPLGLKGDDILLEARILSVVDAYDAITTNRPYRQASSKEETFQILKEASGTQFDPCIIDAFLTLFD